MQMSRRLVPLAKLQEDYYVGDSLRDGGGGNDSEESSSDDEVQAKLKEIAGFHSDTEKGGKSDFELELDAELDDRMDCHVRETLQTGGKERDTIHGSTPRIEEVDEDQDEDMPPLEESSLQSNSIQKVPEKSSLAAAKRKSEGKESPQKKVKFREEDNDVEMKEDKDEEESSDEDLEDDNPIRKAAKEAQKKEGKEKAPDFYDADEDEDNERWVQEHRRAKQGRAPPERKVNPKQTRLEDGSDAVLSCPACMVLLTRDCQRHEIYKDQYRAMFVENCEVDNERLTIEKTGKEKRRERQKNKKQGQTGSSSFTAESDIFVPVKCARCGTKVAVMDNDEVYHFFNVLSGYS